MFVSSTSALAPSCIELNCVVDSLLTNDFLKQFVPESIQFYIFYNFFIIFYGLLKLHIYIDDTE